jgi:hypothetical protein
VLLKSTALTLCFEKRHLNAVPPVIGSVVWYVTVSSYSLLVATSRTKRHRTLAWVTTRCRAVNTDQSLNRIRSSLMTLLPKLEESETPRALRERPLTAQVLTIVLSSLCQRNGNRLKRAGAQYMLKDQHRTLTAPRTPVRRTFGEAPDNKLAPLPEGSYDT